MVHGAWCMVHVVLKYESWLLNCSINSILQNQFAANCCFSHDKDRKRPKGEVNLNTYYALSGFLKIAGAMKLNVPELSKWRVVLFQ
jgi:hypothetical protein